MFSRYRRAVGRGKGELGPAIVLDFISLEQDRPGRLGTTSPPGALSPGLQITELDLRKEKKSQSLLCSIYTRSVLFVWLKMIIVTYNLCPGTN